MSSSWKQLKSFTDARIALGRTGGSLTTEQLLKFRKDHALAKDAVWTDLNSEKIITELRSMGRDVILVDSQAWDRRTFIQRPDLGRRLTKISEEKLKARRGNYDISLCIADGLSALAIENHAVSFLSFLLPLIRSFRLAPITLVNQGRVAVSDQIGELLGSALSIVLIGERPGLSSPDSMGIYMTYKPKAENTDEKRNCISNIRKEGLSYDFAAQKLAFLISESLRRKLSGVELKDTFDPNSILPPKE
ncbi:MAG: ethanolamine ammonia-lyase subunit EutC [Bacteroidota bacterium]